MKSIKNKLMSILAIVVTIVAIYLVMDKYNLNLVNLFKYAFVIFAVASIYTLLHEALHALVAHMLHMKLVMLKLFNIMLLFDEGRVKIYKGKEFGGPGNCLAFPTWKNTPRQWLTYIILPYSITLISVLVLLYVKITFGWDSVVLDCTFALGVLYVLWSIIPIKGSDLYYLWIYAFERSEFQGIYEILLLNYALIFGDVKYEKNVFKIPKLGLDSEEMQGWIYAKLKYDVDLILMGTYKVNKKINNFYREAYKHFSDECKLMYAIYVYLLNGNDDEWRKHIKDIQPFSSYEYYFGKILIERDNNLDLMMEKMEEEVHKFRSIGVKEAYKLERKLYAAMAQNVIAGSGKEGIR